MSLMCMKIISGNLLQHLTFVHPCCRHPQILTVQHPLEESRDCLAFATEQVLASLANIIGQQVNLPTPVPEQLRDFNLFDVEIKYGLLQVSK